MTEALLDQPLGQLACAIPGATAVFHRHKLDFCCGGQQTLREAAQHRGLDGEAIAMALQQRAASDGDGADWRDQSTQTLIAHLLERFHERHRQQLPELIRLARRVEQVHGDRQDCPHGLTDHLETMAMDLESHLQKEEQVLFPMMLRGIPAGQVMAPITVMRSEHDDHGASLQRLAELTDDITAPEDACHTWRALYSGLEELRRDLMQHIHLENNVLFAGHTRFA